MVAVNRALDTSPIRNLIVLTHAVGVTFTAHISTHSYYSLPLVPMVSLGICCLAVPVVAKLDRLPRAVQLASAAAAGLLLLVYMAALHPGLADPSLRTQAAEYARIGTLTHHTPSAVFLSGDLGAGVEYEGFMGGRYWPLLRGDRGDFSAAERFRSRDGDKGYPAVAGMRPRVEYFVVTDVAELRAQPDLERLLRRFRVVASNGAFAIYDLRATA